MIQKGMDFILHTYKHRNSLPSTESNNRSTVQRVYIINRDLYQWFLHFFCDATNEVQYVYCVMTPEGRNSEVDKHVPVDTRMNGVFCKSGLTPYNEDYTPARVEAGSNTSKVALRAVGGDEKGNHCLGYNWATLFLGDVNTAT
jgi:hypothetical protein